LDSKKAQAVNEAEQAGSVGIGGAIAYFLIPWLVSNGYLDEAAVKEGLVMGGAIISYALLKVRQTARWIRSLIDHAVGNHPD